MTECLYLLHFDRPFGRARHYLGHSSVLRLKDRLREHAIGNGASLTKAVFAAGIKVYLARVISNAGYKEEREFKEGRRLTQLCPLCCPMFAGLKDAVYEIDPARPEQPPQRAVWGWASERDHR